MVKIVIYTTPYCPYCIRAKHLLTQKKQDFKEIDVSNKPQLRQKMQQLSGGYTVPQIFIDEKPIGGCDELFALNRERSLDAMLTNSTN